MARIPSDKQVNRIVSHLPGVGAAVGQEADAIAARASANLASHHKTGEHQITTSHGKVDHFVSMEGPAALSVEEGHHTPSGSYVEGLHILGRAAKGG